MCSLELPIINRERHWTMAVQATREKGREGERNYNKERKDGGRGCRAGEKVGEAEGKDEGLRSGFKTYPQGEIVNVSKGRGWSWNT